MKSVFLRLLICYRTSDAKRLFHSLPAEPLRHFQRVSEYSLGNCGRDIGGQLLPDGRYGGRKRLREESEDLRHPLGGEADA